MFPVLPGRAGGERGGQPPLWTPRPHPAGCLELVKRQLFRVGEDWYFLFVLGVLMALISFMMDLIPSGKVLSRAWGPRQSQHPWVALSGARRPRRGNHSTHGWRSVGRGDHVEGTTAPTGGAQGVPVPPAPGDGSQGGEGAKGRRGPQHPRRVLSRVLGTQHHSTGKDAPWGRGPAAPVAPTGGAQGGEDTVG
uniref:Uncharacterized protein n=1 Tax=Anser brachyrhynchus TaxID=132585 RepID=A0A8B9I636_9AVES